MRELNQKYVLHIPLYKFKDNKLTEIDMEDVLNELIGELVKNSYTSFYTQKIKSHYNSRTFDELIITVFSSKDNRKPVEEIFSEWFLKNNLILGQEEYAYEHNSTLNVEKIE